ncbi:MAG: chorismate-binding protein, partial [Solirubrobacterales bacterium]|nr:chorismate-binding protein [Solirubrobacterales bacterium]
MLETASAIESLERRLRGAGRRPRLVSVTFEAPIADPSAAVFGSRLASDSWFAWEQPDRGGFALAGLGCAHESLARGEGRFADLDAECARLIGGRIGDEPPGAPAGSGPVWVGGFAFDPGGGSEPQWSSFPPARLSCPELAILRVEGRSWVTLSARTGPEGPEAILARLRGRLEMLGERAMPILDPPQTGHTRIINPRPPGRYEGAVAAAVERIAAGGLEKVVLAREVVVETPRAHDSAAVFGALRELFPTCYCFCAGTPEAAFLGASPELLVRRRGAGAATVGLAGSTRRSADPAVDDHLGERLRVSVKNRAEHDIVVRRIARELGRHAVWVEAASDPEIVKVANIQHLGTPIHAQLAEPHSAIELAGLLHPTPAVGGEPGEPALAAIAELEGLDRG